MHKTLIVLCVVLIVFSSNFGQLQYVTELPNQLNEVSGLVHLNDSTVWVLEDGGNHDEIYKVDFNGDVLTTLKVKNTKIPTGKT